MHLRTFICICTSKCLKVCPEYRDLVDSRALPEHLEFRAKMEQSELRVNEDHLGYAEWLDRSDPLALWGPEALTGRWDLQEISALQVLSEFLARQVHPVKQGKMDHRSVICLIFALCLVSVSF